MDCSVAMRGFSAFRKKIESPALRVIADHWEEVRDGNRMPSWGDLRPSSIAPYLTRIWSCKYDRVTGEFTTRLAGNRITMGFGVNFRGTPLRDIHPPHVLEEIQPRMTRLVLGPHLYRSTGQLFRQGDRVTEGERIVLPLASDGIHCDGALGAADYPFRPPPVPRRPVELIMDREDWFALTD